MATSLSTPLLQPSDPVSPRTQQRLAHVAERRDNLAKVLDVDDVRGVPLTELLASCAAIFAEGGQAAREDPAGTFGKSRSVKALDTGSVAIKTMAKAKLPLTKCQCTGTSNMGFVSEPTMFSKRPKLTIPSSPPSMVRHEPTCVNMRMAAPKRQNKVEVSPIEPGIRPKKAFVQPSAVLATCGL